MNISGYIPSRLRTQVSFPERSFEEMAWGPSLMMAKNDALKSKVSDLDAALDFEYHEKDDPYIAPKIDKLRGELNTLQDEIVKGGYNPLLEQKMLNFRRKYQKELGSHGDIGRARKNYAAMQSALQEYDKNHKDDPEWFRQKAKQNIVNTYQGMYDDYGKYREFTPGQATKYRDINADFVDFAGKAGMQGGLQELIEGKLQVIPTTINGKPFVKVVESTPGYVSSNKKNLESLANQFFSEYNDPTTDRGIFASIAGLPPEKIGQSLSNMAGLTYKENYAKQPTWNAGLQSIPEGSSKEGKEAGNTGAGLPTLAETKAKPEIAKEVNSDRELMANAWSNGRFDEEAAKKYEIANRSGWNPRSIITDIDKMTLGTGKEFTKDYKKVYDKYKTQYKGLWEDFKNGTATDLEGNPITSEQQLFNLALDRKEKDSYVLDSKVSLANYESWEDLSNKAGVVPEGQAMFTSTDGKDEVKTIAQAKGMYKLAGLDPKDNFNLWLDSEGNTLVKIPLNEKGEEKWFKVNKDAVAGNNMSNKAKEVLKITGDFMKDYSMTKEERNAQNNHLLPISKTMGVRTVIDPNNILNKKLVLEGYGKVIDPATGQEKVEWGVIKDNVSLSEIAQYATYGENYILSKNIKKD